MRHNILSCQCYVHPRCTVKRTASCSRSVTQSPYILQGMLMVGMHVLLARCFAVMHA